MTYWVSCLKFTVCVTTKHDIITDAAPVVKRFIGQPFINLKRWFGKFGKVTVHDLDDVIDEMRRLGDL